MAHFRIMRAFPAVLAFDNLLQTAQDEAANRRPNVVGADDKR